MDFQSAKEHVQFARFTEAIILLGKICEAAREFRFPTTFRDEKTHWEEIGKRYHGHVKQALLRVRQLRNQAAHPPHRDFTLMEANHAMFLTQIALDELLGTQS